jgi:hypothetical protein
VFHPAFALVWMLAGYITIGVVEAVLDVSRRIAGKPPRLVEHVSEDKPIEASPPKEG